MVNPNRISIDTRTIKAGDTFIPIKGKNFDGRDFIPAALKKGASVLKVKNGLKALQDIAACHRQKFNIPIIGVTGSSGKTTTKDMITSILSQELKTLKNEENLNNEIGVPMTLLKLKKEHQAAVIEMAMQKLGELELLAKIVKPTIAVITNIGEAHLKYLKTKRNIAKAKSEILKFLQKGDWAVLPSDDQYTKFLCKKAPKGVNTKLFGIENVVNNEKFLKYIPLPGRHNIYNALAAIKVAKILKIKDSSIIAGLKKFKPSSKRMEFIKLKNKATLINDSYNANPSSMRAALLTLAGLKAKRRIAVLGDMLELGSSAKSAHKKTGNLVRKLGIDVLITVGKLSRGMKGDFHYTNPHLAAKKLKTIIKPRDIILVKGSRGIKMEAAVVELADTYV